MAQFDPSIISQIPDMAPNPVQAKANTLKLQDLMDTQTLNRMKLNEAGKQEQEQETYKSILKGSDLSTDKGATEAAEKLTRAGLPDQAMKFMKERQAIAGGALDVQLQKIKIAESQTSALVDAGDLVVRQVEDYKQSNPNATPAMLDAKTQEFLVPAMDQLAQQRPDLAAAINQYKLKPGALTHAGLMNLATSNKQSLEKLRELHAEQKGDRDERAQNTRDLAEATREADQRRKEKAEDFKEEQVKKKEEANEKASDATADLIGKYRLRPPMGLGSRSPESRELMEKVAKKYPDYDATRFDEKRAAVLAFGTGKQGQAVLALNNAIAHMDTLSELTDALQNGDVRQVNRIANLWASETGGPAPSNFDAAKGIVTEEVSKAVLPGGGGVQERLEIAANAQNAKSPEILKGVIKTWRKLLSGQMTNMRQQYKRTTGLDNFDEMMSPQALRELQGEGPAIVGDGPPPSNDQLPKFW